MKNLTEFNTKLEYNTSAIDETLDTPNVSLIKSNGEIMYRGSLTDYINQYLTLIPENDNACFIASYNSSKQPSMKGFEYSIDGGSTWTELTTGQSSRTVEVSKGSKVLFRASGLKTTNDELGVNGIGNIKCLYRQEGRDYEPCTFKAEGNIMSMVYGDSFNEEVYKNGVFYKKYTVIPNNAQFVGFFQESKITDAENLVLPATTLTEFCYRKMFMYADALVKAPTLPALELKRGCYEKMFEMVNNSNPLNYVKAMFLTTPSEWYTNRWMHNAKNTGTFVKNSAATWNVTGEHGIPNGWTVETASE